MTDTADSTLLCLLGARFFRHSPQQHATQIQNLQIKRDTFWHRNGITTHEQNKKVPIPALAPVASIKESLFSFDVNSSSCVFVVFTMYCATKFVAIGVMVCYD